MTLRDGQWLNDEVINFYGAMIQKRADEDLVADTPGGAKRKRRDIHFFNSFFFGKMEKAGYDKSLARWTRTVSYISLERLFIRLLIHISPPSVS